LIHDYLEEKWKWKKFKDIQANAYILLFLWRTFSSLIAWYIFIINPLSPVYLTIIAYLIVLLSLFFIIDKWQEIEKKESTKKHIITGLKFILKDKFIFYFVIIISLISSIWNIYWFTYQPYFKNIWISIENIGILFAITWIFSAIWAQIIKKLQNIFSEIKIVYITIFLLLLSSIFIQLFNIYWAILWLIIISIMFGFIMSFWNNILIKKSPKKYKSTILSIFSFTITIWYITFSLISWYLIDLIWLEKLYIWNIILIILVILFTLLKLRK